ncbi:MAG: hypothetical protein A2057_00590 [Ignavibacteria bacterium GWA2_35_9]|nr:MAG: hypothetical protein A2057_00590 [Ignavibacteria bacterium GWA2_35_9]OGU48286.1 MAG: hypothetical protein A2000_02235 [Ignavibacteria bacterium GWB2_36_8]
MPPKFSFLNNPSTYLGTLENYIKTNTIQFEEIKKLIGETRELLNEVDQNKITKDNFESWNEKIKELQLQLNELKSNDEELKNKDSVVNEIKEFIKIEELKLPEVVLERYRHIILQEQIKASEMDKLIREILEVNNSIHSSNSFL